MWSRQLWGWTNNLNRVVPSFVWGNSRCLELLMAFQAFLTPVKVWQSLLMQQSVISVWALTTLPERTVLWKCLRGCRTPSWCRWMRMSWSFLCMSWYDPGVTLSLASFQLNIECVVSGEGPTDSTQAILKGWCAFHLGMKAGWKLMIVMAPVATFRISRKTANITTFITDQLLLYSG